MKWVFASKVAHRVISGSGPNRSEEASSTDFFHCPPASAAPKIPLFCPFDPQPFIPGCSEDQTSDVQLTSGNREIPGSCFAARNDACKRFPFPFRRSSLKNLRMRRQPLRRPTENPLGPDGLRNVIPCHRHAKVSILDRGFLFADGIYEVAAVLDGKLIDNASLWRGCSARRRDRAGLPETWSAFRRSSESWWCATIRSTAWFIWR